MKKKRSLKFGLLLCLLPAPAEAASLHIAPPKLPYAQFCKEQKTSSGTTAFSISSLLDRAGETRDRELLAATQNLMLEALAEGDCRVLLTFAKLYGSEEYGLADGGLHLQWLEAAASSGDAEAMLKLGNLHAVRTDMKAARRWWERAAEKGNAQAAALLAASEHE